MRDGVVARKGRAVKTKAIFGGFLHGVDSFIGRLEDGIERVFFLRERPKLEKILEYFLLAAILFIIFHVGRTYERQEQAIREWRETQELKQQLQEDLWRHGLRTVPIPVPPRERPALGWDEYVF